MCLCLCVFVCVCVCVWVCMSASTDSTEIYRLLCKLELVQNHSSSQKKGGGFGRRGGACSVFVRPGSHSGHTHTHTHTHRHTHTHTHTHRHAKVQLHVRTRFLVLSGPSIYSYHLSGWPPARPNFYKVTLHIQSYRRLFRWRKADTAIIAFGNWNWWELGVGKIEKYLKSINTK